MWVYILVAVLAITIIVLLFFTLRKKAHSCRDRFTKQKLEGLYSLISPSNEWKTKLPLDDDIIEALDTASADSTLTPFDTSIPLSATHFPNSEQVYYLINLAATLDFILSSKKIAPPSGVYMDTVKAFYQCAHIGQRICVGFLIQNLTSRAVYLNIPINDCLSYFNCCVNNCMTTYNTPSATLPPCQRKTCDKLPI